MESGTQAMAMFSNACVSSSNDVLEYLRDGVGNVRVNWVELCLPAS